MYCAVDAVSLSKLDLQNNGSFSLIGISVWRDHCGDISEHKTFIDLSPLFGNFH
jgi:hypothetical protein